MTTKTTTLTAEELALYLGCEIDCNGQIETLDSVCFQDGTCETLFRGNMRNLRELEEIKPILRPLSDMTMGEKDHLLWANIHTSFTPSEFQYLLSRGFDIFNWIEQGKAIDKTKNPTT